ncbi:MAG: PD-(D/E)XK nuclease family protein, partial [Alistipes sp.]|nr:PD-(D/E)XK nuclease family protein [Alistipes sp.]
MQQTFLAEVAAKLFEQYGDNISTLTIVLPSRRARLFFSEALSHLSDKPLWQPEYISIDDIMSEASSYTSGEKIRLITELYKIYSQYHDESFDKFYFWGEMLLSDFDLIDKYMIDADMLFRNISDIKELEADMSYLTPEMRRVINTFWSHFEKEKSLSDEKRKFLKIWLSLAPIYHALRERLCELGFAYSGMIYRSAVENLKQGKELLNLDREYIFIGFNALSECEKEMMRYISRNGRCQFFWDYDNYYTQDPEAEAGRFLRDNIKQFKPLHDISHNNFIETKKRFTAISTVSNVMQCKYIDNILKEISEDLEFDKQTAIVLTDESLLVPLLHSLPEKVAQKVNVTMGYPLRQTTAYSFLERLIELQKNCRHSADTTTFYHTDTEGILSHPYIASIIGEAAKNYHDEIIKQRKIRVSSDFFKDSELLSIIFSSTDSWSELSEYLLKVIREICYNSEYKELLDTTQRAYLGLLIENTTTTANCVAKCDIELTTSTFTSLLRRHLQTIRIPYSGEPLQGLQVMGILETRNLDFKNVIILSMNDDNFPGNVANSSSFIPYNLRAAYGIPTPEHHEGVYAYYFYRLIQRAERVDMLYCSHADEKSTGEQSRYIYQLEYESLYTINRTNV